jgi:hypothetical protein
VKRLTPIELFDILSCQINLSVKTIFEKAEVLWLRGAGN